jgi:hypothetical protein
MHLLSRQMWPLLALSTFPILKALMRAPFSLRGWCMQFVHLNDYNNPEDFCQYGSYRTYLDWNNLCL